MRTSNGCTLEQSLTIEATNVIKQAINLSRRRGHAHVTPIHVATVMLASPSGIFQRACLKSHSHPLQYKALELCFNVALNRLPTTTSGPILGPQSSPYPSFSNALVAAFKRAQAHQRRGSIENQQQPILALKIETEQLVVSILDDPSVSRVMREAGFSSTNIKDNVEKVVSLEVSPNIRSQFSNQTIMTPLIIPLDHGVRNEDVSGVISSLVSSTRKKMKNTVVVSECVGNCESIVRAVKDKIERGDVPNEIRNAQFLSLDLMSTKNFSREEIEVKLGDLRCLLKGDVVLYLGNLKWVSEHWGVYGEQRRSFYCPIEHMVMGIRRILYENSIQTLRVLGIANFSSYIKCKTGNPSLETLLDLHPLAIPVGSLDLSLKLDSTLLQGEKKSAHLSCCSDCSANFHREAQYLALSVRKMESRESLPSWLQKCKEESIEESMSDDQKDQVQIKELCKKWNSICSSIHKTINFSSPFISHNNLHSVFESKWPSKEHNFFMSDQIEPPKPDLLSNPNSTPNSASSSEATDPIMEKAMEFKDNTDENLEAICSALENKVPWQKEIIPDVARTVLKCRAGLMRRKGKQETWMFFLGQDDDGKIKVAKELANLVFGSHKSFKYILKNSLLSSPPLKLDSRKKRARDESDYLERFGREIRDDPHRVFYLDDIDQVDHFSQKGIKKAIENGVITLYDGESVALDDAIVIFSCESFSSSGSRAYSPFTKQKLYHEYNNDQETEKVNDNSDCDGEEAVSPCLSLDLNLSIDKDEDHSVDEIGILQSVDRQIFFRIQIFNSRVRGWLVRNLSVDLQVC
ncbi:hypothetical protein V2J09_001190 [Rumex salicifolius]